ncbi:peroxisome assembly factor 2 [Lingula anatina]|uniref:Peroxisomal ATPase PEX6 n=1 Tax=Lingula anatina TaxID=7574 RepID=A0A1S3I4X9_LINAN|nr:peroxisome assembly factor 2 [Lingula anatina]|eukprot:XP_013393278.1 peroxisome assembly factor 2 [Lingula anatina]
MAAPSRRKMFAAKFSVLPNLRGIHPLHLQLNEQQYDLVFENNENDHAIGAVSKKTATPGFPSLQVSVYKSKVHIPSSSCIENADLEETNLLLGCTETFLHYYGFSVEDDIVLHSVESFPMKRVVIGAKTVEAYTWASDSMCSPSLLINICRGPVLVRKQDVLLLPTNLTLSQSSRGKGTPPVAVQFDLVVLECEPVCQGILSVSTEIVVTKISGLNNEHKPADATASDSSDLTEFHLPVLSEFAKPITDVLSGKATHSDITVDRGSSDDCVYKLFCVDSKEVWDNMCTGYMKEHDIKDPNTIGVISVNTAKHNGLYHDSLVHLTLVPVESSSDTKGLDTKISTATTSETEDDKHERDTTKLLKRYVSLSVSSHPNIEDNSIYVTPVFRHNLLFRGTNFPRHTSKLQVSIKPLEEDDNKASPRSCSTSCHAKIPYAREVHISVVHSPCHPVAETPDSVMKEYFSTARLLSVDDIIAVSTKGSAQCFQELTETVDQRLPVVYFKVTRYEPTYPGWDCCLVDIQHTSLFQAGIVQSYLPVTTQFWDGPRTFCPPLHLPKGLRKIKEQIEALCLPYLNSSSRRSLSMASFLLKGPVGCGKGIVVRAVASALSMQVYKVSCHDISGETSSATEQRVKNMFTKARSYSPCILYLSNIDALSKDRDGISEDARVTATFLENMQTANACDSDWPIIVVATSNSSNQMSTDMCEGFLHQVVMKVPTEEERRDMVDFLLASVPCSSSLSLSHIAQRTAGMVFGDLQALVTHAKRSTLRRVKQACIGTSSLSFQQEEDICRAGLCVSQEDFDLALDQLQAAHSDAIGAPQIPNVSWEDVGGLADIKAEILDTIQLPLEHPELFAAGLRRSGVLLYGPPGTGKTLLAKAVATECSLNFLSVKGPELINMYVGQSEENVREVFHRARSAAPCVVFFDELDSLAPNRGRSGDSGGVMDRVVSQLLAELDGLHKACDVFVIGATNRPDLLDPALLRPGRFDKLLYLGVSDTREAQVKILKALTRKFQLGQDVRMEDVAAQCPFTLTGADLYALCSDSLLNAMKRKIEMLENGEETDQTTLVVENQDFTNALENLTPSVSEAELQHYKLLQFSLLAS